MLYSVDGDGKWAGGEVEIEKKSKKRIKIKSNRNEHVK